MSSSQSDKQTNILCSLRFHDVEPMVAVAPMPRAPFKLDSPATSGVCAVSTETLRLRAARASSRDVLTEVKDVMGRDGDGALRLMNSCVDPHA
jgi:hypothetical protein